jgi:hypothetical protein
LKKLNRHAGHSVWFFFESKFINKLSFSKAKTKEGDGVSLKENYLVFNGKTRKKERMIYSED